MRFLRVAAVTLTSATAIFIAAPSAVRTIAHAGTPSKCDRSGSRTIARNAEVRLFSVRNDGFEGETFLVGCWRRSGRRHTLATALKPEVVNSYRAFDLVRLRGRFVAFRFVDVDDCRYGCPDGDRSSQRVYSFDVRSGRCFHAPISERPAGNRLLLDARGAIAWPQWLEHNQIEVRVLDASGGRSLDSGAIHPESLSLTRLGRLSWVNDTTPRNQQLAHTPAVKRCQAGSYSEP